MAYTRKTSFLVGLRPEVRIPTPHYLPTTSIPRLPIDAATYVKKIETKVKRQSNLVLARQAKRLKLEQKKKQQHVLTLPSAADTELNVDSANDRKKEEEQASQSEQGNSSAGSSPSSSGETSSSTVSSSLSLGLESLLDSLPGFPSPSEIAEEEAVQLQRRREAEAASNNEDGGSESPPSKPDCKAEQLKVMLTNRGARHCPACTKPNAFTLPNCNQCGEPIEHVELTRSSNVAMGFVLGLEQADSYRLSMSVRHECDDVLVCDDMQQIAPLHFNAIPTKHYVPDWRHLLRRPEEGLQLQEHLIDTARMAAIEHYLSHDDWRRFFLKSPNQFDPKKDFFPAFNYPPSQNQLHLQFTCPVLMPFQRYLFDKGVHFTPKRLFPTSYTEQCLSAAMKHPLPSQLLQVETPIDAIIDHFRNTHGIDYDIFRQLDVKRFGDANDRFANWKPEHFFGEAREVEVVNDESMINQQNKPKTKLLFFPRGSEQPDETVDVMGLVKEDSKRLQCYGRPFCNKQRPTGTFYTFAKHYEDLEWW